MGHIQLSRQADLVVVCPATADLMARMAAGIADDLATTLLLATDKPVLAVPAMNVRMWERRHAAQCRALRAGVTVLEPDVGAMACGEFGPGRLPEPEAVWPKSGAVRAGGSMDRSVGGAPRPDHRRPHPRADRPGALHRQPVERKAGLAIAGAAAAAGARVTLVSGPVTLSTPAGVTRVDVETAREMAAAVEAALPADVAIMVAAVADWRVADAAGQKLKKDGTGAPAAAGLGGKPRYSGHAVPRSAPPALVVGFAAETNDVIAHALAKRQRKGADWIVANDVSAM
jgi:phosphopantothenoylcysteine decarboxylase/phosphopantothenate--cysteine ligase